MTVIIRELKAKIWIKDDDAKKEKLAEEITY